MNNVLFNKTNTSQLKTPNIEEMAEVVIWEVGHHFKMNMDAWWYRLLRKMVMVPARKFAQVMYDFDQAVAQKTLYEATRQILPRFTSGWQVSAASGIPKEGPLLVVSNHPGAADSLAAMAALERPDVHFLVIKRPMLTIMPNVSRYMFYLEEYNPARFNVIRSLIQILKNQETLLMFPRGNLEPDPALYPGALASLQNWSESLGVILSKVPDAMLQLMLVRNVVLPKAWKSRIANFGKTTKTRHQIAMILQTAMQQLFKGWKIPAKVTLPTAISARTLAPSLDPRKLNQAVKAYIQEEMTKTFENL